MCMRNILPWQQGIGAMFGCILLISCVSYVCSGKFGSIALISCVPLSSKEIEGEHYFFSLACHLWSPKKVMVRLLSVVLPLFTFFPFIIFPICLLALNR